MNRVLVGALATVALVAAGCGSDFKPSAQSPAAKAAASDEQQIHDLLKKQEAAVAAFDLAASQELKCTKYREDVEKMLDEVIPPIGEFGTAQELAAVSAADLATGYKELFPGASDSTLLRFADALVRYDVVAYEEAFVEIVRQISKFTLDKVENVKITGDTATADVTATEKVGSEPAKTETKTISFVEEDGQWKECEPPSS